jgi:hypothetical protein
MASYKDKTSKRYDRKRNKIKNYKENKDIGIKFHLIPKVKNGSQKKKKKTGTVG